MNAGSEWFKYKHFHSLVFFASCTTRYKLSFIDVGALGRRSDGGIIHSDTGAKFRGNRMNVSRSQAISEYNSFKFPYVMVPDEAFPLEVWMMKPYPKANLKAYECVYNYRLSRARRVIENVFGILVSHWRIFGDPICTYV